MHETRGVGRHEPASGLYQDGQGARPRGPLAGGPRRERHPLDQFHRQPDVLGDGADIEARDDVRKP